MIIRGPQWLNPNSEVQTNHRLRVCGQSSGKLYGFDLGGYEGLAVGEAKGCEPVLTDDGSQFEQFDVEVLGGFKQGCEGECPSRR